MPADKEFSGTSWRSARHSVALITEMFPMSKVNEALERLRTGEARYRTGLVNDWLDQFL
jgi:D-arabinose 1-dehydrogenase-like Zn-dependent alcohol dehydrogenase